MIPQPALFFIHAYRKDTKEQTVMEAAVLAPDVLPAVEAESEPAVDEGDLMEYDRDNPNLDYGKIDVDNLDLHSLPEETRAYISDIQAGNVHDVADRFVDTAMAMGVDQDRAIDFVAGEVAQYRLTHDKKAFEDFTTRWLLWFMDNKDKLKIKEA